MNRLLNIKYPISPILLLWIALYTPGCSSDQSASEVIHQEPPEDIGFEHSPEPSSGPAFIDQYQTNTLDNPGSDSNAVLRILSGMNALWGVGDQWDSGNPRDVELTRSNIDYVVQTTLERSQAQTERAYVYDRQHQSHGVIDGLGPLAPFYRRGAKATSSISGLPTSRPQQRISDRLPEGAEEGWALGAGSEDSSLGKVVELINTARGPYSSSNPAKYHFQYPRPWRMNRDNQVVDAGRLDAMGFPVYASGVQVVPELLRQRGETPDKDGGFPSGHTNAAYLAAMAMAYAVPERFQAMMVRASELGHSRIEAGMHSPLDVMGGRVMATALMAATLNDPQNKALKEQAREQSLDYFMQQIDAESPQALRRFAQSAENDPYSDHPTNRLAVMHRLTYNLYKDSASEHPMTVPKGAEVLLETRFPYLSKTQRRSVLATTAVGPGYPLLETDEPWGRLDLFTAADGYGEFIGDVVVSMDASLGGFNAEDQWRNDIGGSGKLKKVGSGQLTLSGNNRYSGGTELQGGTLIAQSTRALGAGDVYLAAGRLKIAADHRLWIAGDYSQSDKATLTLTPRASQSPALVVSGAMTINSGAILALEGLESLATDSRLPIIYAAGGIRGTFSGLQPEAKGLKLSYSEDKVFLIQE